MRCPLVHANLPKLPKRANLPRCLVLEAPGPCGIPEALPSHCSVSKNPFASTTAADTAGRGRSPTPRCELPARRIIRELSQAGERLQKWHSVRGESEPPMSPPHVYGEFGSAVGAMSRKRPSEFELRPTRHSEKSVIVFRTGSPGFKWSRGFPAVDQTDCATPLFSARSPFRIEGFWRRPRLNRMPAPSLVDSDRRDH